MHRPRPSSTVRLDDAAWASAPIHDAFTQRFPNEGMAPEEQTTFRVLYDDRSIFVGIDCTQQTVPVVARLTRRDRVIEADRISVAFDTRGDGRSPYEFTVNAAGVQSDAIRFDDTGIDTDWDETWDARVATTNRGWSAELRIRSGASDSPMHQKTVVGMQLRRYVSRRQETDEWSFIPRAGAGEVSRYGRLDHVGAEKAGTDVELRPFVLGRLDRRDAGTESLRTGVKLGASAGLDAKWHAKRDLTLDLALPPGLRPGGGRPTGLEPHERGGPATGETTLLLRGTRPLCDPDAASLYPAYWPHRAGRARGSATARPSSIPRKRRRCSERPS